MGDQVAARRTPGLWNWYRAQTEPWPPYALPAVLLALGLPSMMDGEVLALAYIGMAAAAAASPLVPWYMLRGTAAFPLVGPPPADRLARYKSGELALLWAIAVPLAVPIFRDVTADPWVACLARVAVLSGVMLLFGALMGWAARRSASRRASPLDQLRQDLQRLGYAATLHDTAPAGHATLTLDTSHGPELLWYLHSEEPSRVLPEMVLLMWRQLEAHSMARGWIVTRATWSTRLADFGRAVGVVFAPPDHFARLRELPEAQRFEPLTPCSA